MVLSCVQMRRLYTEAHWANRVLKMQQLCGRQSAHEIIIWIIRQQKVDSST